MLALILALAARADPGAAGGPCRWLTPDLQTTPLEANDRADVYDALKAAEPETWRCALIVISVRPEFGADVATLLGPADGVGLRAPAPGADPEAARVLEILRAMPRDQASARWEGAAPAGRLAVLMTLQKRDPGYCRVLTDAYFDPVARIEQEADRRRGHDCPIDAAGLAALRASPRPHTRADAVELMSRVLPRSTEHRVALDACEDARRGDACMRYDATPRWRWRVEARRARAALMAIAAQDPDEDVRRRAVAALAGAHLSAAGRPLPPEFVLERRPTDDYGCGTSDSEP